MEEKIKQKSPTLHKYLFTVTTFPKLFAMFLFIILPFVGFYLGMRYQKKITVIAPIISEVKNTNVLKATPTVAVTPTSIKTTETPTNIIENWQGITMEDKNNPSLLIYKNEGIGFEFKYPKEFGTIKAREWYGTEGKKGRGIWFDFSTPTGKLLPIAIAAINLNFGGIGSSQTVPTSGGYNINKDGTISFRRYLNNLTYPYRVFNGENVEGVIVVQQGIPSGESTMGLPPYTRIVFNLNNPEFQAIDFLVNSNNEDSNTETLISIAKTFSILKSK